MSSLQTWMKWIVMWSQCSCSSSPKIALTVQNNPWAKRDLIIIFYYASSTNCHSLLLITEIISDKTNLKDRLHKSPPVTTRFKMKAVLIFAFVLCFFFSEGKVERAQKKNTHHVVPSLTGCHVNHRTAHVLLDLSVLYPQIKIT
jgi:hypothetical protein